jgi:two-component system, OmpR family, response regulator
MRLAYNARQQSEVFALVRILLVENNKHAASLVRDDLKDSAHGVTVATNGVDALYLAASQEWELLIIDHSSPGLDSLGIVRTLRSGGVTTPILLLMAPGDESGSGVAAGADECLPRNFTPEVLKARVAALGRSPGRAQPETLLRVGDVEIDLLTRCVKRGEKQLELQPREFKLLEFLVRNVGKVLDRTTLLEKVWDYHFDPRTNVVESHISRLRAKIDRGYDVHLIHTIRGAGYTLREPA